MQEPSPTPRLQRPIVRGALALVLLAGLAAIFFAVRDDGSGDVGGVPTDARGALDDRAPVRGDPAPDFELRTIDGELMALGDLRGKVVWINFWATWCQPCRKELPDIQKLYDEKRGEGLEVIAINLEEQPAQAREYWEDMGLSLPMLLDVESSVYDQYQLQGLPDSFFIDRDGNLAAIQYGFLTEEQARERLAQAGLP